MGKLIRGVLLAGILLSAAGCNQVDFETFARDFVREVLAAALF